jgi:hypothetical protein
MNSISKWTSLTASASLHCRFKAAAKFYVSIIVTKCSHKIKESQHSLEKYGNSRELATETYKWHYALPTCQCQPVSFSDECS